MPVHIVPGEGMVKAIAYWSGQVRREGDIGHNIKGWGLWGKEFQFEEIIKS